MSTKNTINMAAAHGEVPHSGFVFFRLENEYQPSDEVILEKFSWLFEIIHGYTGYRVTHYTIREDSSRILQISGWDSVKQHYEDFHSSPDMRGVLDEFGGVLDVRSSWHADIPFLSINSEAPVITLCRFCVPSRSRSDFESVLSSLEPKSANGAGRHVLLGWRVENAGWSDKDENINHLSKYRSPVENRETQTNLEQTIDPTELHELDALIPWTNLEFWKNAVQEGQELQPFQELLKHVARLEVWHLEMLELPEYKGTDGENEDEDEDEDNDNES